MSVTCFSDKDVQNILITKSEDLNTCYIAAETACNQEWQSLKFAVVYIMS